MALTPFIYKAQVIRVVDGDTVNCRIDLGFRSYAEHSIRLADIDAPELFSGEDRAAGAIAKSVVEQWVAAGVDLAEGDEWPFLLHSERAGGFGRWAGTLYRPQDDRSLNDWLVENNYAVRSPR